MKRPESLISAATPMASRVMDVFAMTSLPAGMRLSISRRAASPSSTTRASIPFSFSAAMVAWMAASSGSRSQSHMAPLLHVGLRRARRSVTHRLGRGCHT